MSSNDQSQSLSEQLDAADAAHRLLLRDTDKDLEEAQNRIAQARARIAAANKKYQERLRAPKA
jgi:peptidoglycan hydrolase CwlO-like protein